MGLETLVVIAAVAAATSVGTSIYSMTQGTPGPDIPTGPPTPPPLSEGKSTAPEQAADLTKPIATEAEATRETQDALSLRSRRGRAYTILSGPSGLYTAPARSGVKSLLGE